MAKELEIPLNPRALLDTAMPITDREPGTLVVAREVNSKYWGPREGSVGFARVTQGDGNGFLYDYVTFDGATGSARGLSTEDAQRDLGTKWTLDIWFRLTDHAYAGASGKDYIPLINHSSTYGSLIVALIGPADATNVGKVFVSLLNTASKDVSSASTYTQRGSVAVAEGTTQDKITHVRVVRDGGQLTIFTNGLINSVGASSGTLVATEGIVQSSGISLNFGFGVTVDSSYASGFKGRFYGACLRDGAFDSYPIEASFPHNYRGRNVHWFLIGRRITDGTYPHLMDLSRFHTHAGMNFTGWSFAASNDVGFPMPAPVQGVGSWASVRARTTVAAMIGGRLHRKQVS